MSYHSPALVLGVDMGGTNTAFGAVDAEGNILCRGSIPTTGHASFEDFIESLYREVCQTLERSGYEPVSLKAIGVGAPCINSQSGVIEGAVNLPWPSPLPLTAELTKVFGIPAYSENDANIAALGELYYGRARGMDNFIMLTLGTGVGSAIICDGRLLKGKRGLAGELGHVCVCQGPGARLCNCGRKGCLDAYASARGLIETARELMETTELPSKLREKDTLEAGVIGNAAAEGDPLALEVMRITGEILGYACAQFTAFSSPAAFIFFGGVAKSFPLFEPTMVESFQKNLLWVYEGQVDFLKSSLPEADAAILGASAVARNMLTDR